MPNGNFRLKAEESDLWQMSDYSKTLISKLGLLPHPEGGYYKEIYRSDSEVNYHSGKRPALTTIYFLLEKEQASRWHEVDADEVWHYYEGDALELFLMPPDFSRIEKILLGEVSTGLQPVRVVPAGWWQAARPAGEFALCGCTVAPGFEFAGFRFLNEDEKEIVKQVSGNLPQLL